MEQVKKQDKKAIISNLEVVGNKVVKGEIACQFSVSLSQEAKDAKESQTVELIIDLAGIGIEELISGWFNSARIRQQGVLRLLTEAEIKDYSGSTVSWDSLGKKILSVKAQAGKLMAEFGIDEKTATWAVSHRSEFNALLEKAMRGISINVG